MNGENKVDGSNGFQNSLPLALARHFAALFGISSSALFLRGMIFLLIGLLFLLRPDLTMMAVTMVVGAYILIEGIMLSITAWNLKESTRGLFVFNALLLIALGLFSLLSPLKMDCLWIIFIGIWMLLGGFQALFYPVKSGSGRFWAVVSGALSIAIGVVFVLTPVIGLMTVAWLIALLLIICGLSIAASSFMIR